MHHYKRWVIFVAAIFLLVSASLVGNANLYFMAALLLLLPLISYGIGTFSLRDLEFSRETPTSGWEDETVLFHVLVRSRSRMPRLFLYLSDQLPKPLRTASDEPIVFNAAPNSVTRVSYPVELTKRGAYKLETLTITALDPLGIYAFSKRYTVQSEILVYPVPQEIPNYALSGSERFGFQELPVGATRGSGVDPDGVREYIPGDPLRRMHWKSTARTGKLSVIEFEESHAVNVVMAMDLHEGIDVGEGKQSTLEYMVRAAASIAQTSIRQGASVRLITGDVPDMADSPGRGSEHLFAILTSLARVQANDRARLSERLVERVGNLLPGTTLVVLTSRLDPELPGALAHYSACGAVVLVYYAEPRSFAGQSTGFAAGLPSGISTGLPGGARLPSREAQQELLDGLCAARVMPVMLRRNDECLIRPEPITDVRNIA